MDSWNKWLSYHSCGRELCEFQSGNKDQMGLIFHVSLQLALHGAYYML